MNSYKIVENDEVILKVEYDDKRESPRKNMDNLGTMICWHPKYDLGDEHNYEDEFDFLYYLAQDIIGDTYGNKLDERLERNSLRGFSDINTLRRIVDNSSDIFKLPLFTYEHGGITMSTSRNSCPWDSSSVGFIYVTKEQLREHYGVKRVSQKLLEKAIYTLESEVKIYDKYLTGDVFGYVLEDKSENLIDCCFGFYGDDFQSNGLMEQLGDEYKSLVCNLEWA